MGLNGRDGAADASGEATAERNGDEYRQRLYAIMADDHLTVPAKRDRALAIGREYLGVENGHVERRDAEAGTHEIVASVNGESEFVPEGMVVDAAKTFCRWAIEQAEPLAIANAPVDGFGDHPAYDEFGMACYLGAPVTVDGEAYGTVCFVDREVRDREFTATERSFVELLATMLGREIEACRHERALEERERRLDRREEVITVLNRVLRHNLRNKSSAVTGYAEAIAERTAGEPEQLARRIVDQGWELAALSDKAGVLDAVVHGEADASARDVVTLVRAGVADGNQSARADVCGRETVTLSTPPSAEAVATDRLQRAVAELVDNALRHTGADPTVAVTVESTDDGVVVEVSDDGPGLPPNERAVFESGAETKLDHGNGLGLWLVDWIVTDAGGRVTTAVDDGTTVSVHLAAADGTEREGGAGP